MDTLKHILDVIYYLGQCFLDLRLCIDCNSKSAEEERRRCAKFDLLINYELNPVVVRLPEKKEGEDASKGEIYFFSSMLRGFCENVVEPAPASGDVRVKPL